MGSPLSVCLLEAGFLSVYGTTENNTGDKGRVQRGEPFTYDTNNGVSVVYDERGQPWIMRGGFNQPEFCEKHKLQPLLRGAYVPHSNDGGKFVSEMLRSPESALRIANKKARGLSRVIEKIMSTTQLISVPLGSETDQRLKEIDLWLERGRNIQCAHDEVNLDRFLSGL